MRLSFAQRTSRTGWLVFTVGSASHPGITASDHLEPLRRRGLAGLRARYALRQRQGAGGLHSRAKFVAGVAGNGAKAGNLAE